MMTRRLFLSNVWSKFASYPVLGVLLSILFVRLFWAFVVPLFEFPDEQAHIATVHYWVQEKKAPVVELDDLSAEMTEAEHLLGTFRDELGNNRFTYHPEYRIEYTEGFVGKYEERIRSLNQPEYKGTYTRSEAAYYPPLYYWYSGIWYGLSYFGNLFLRVWMIRLAAVMLGFATVGVSYLIGKSLFKKEVWAIQLALLVGLHPMLSFLNAGVNSDNLHIFLYTVFIWLGIRLINQGWDKHLAMGIGAVIGLDLLTKTQGYVLLPTLGVAILLLLLKQKGKINWRELIMVLGIVSIMVILIAGWQEIPKFWNVFVNQTSYLTFNRKVDTAPEFWPFVNYSLNRLYAQNIVWYWGVFKWLGVVLPKPLWWIANRLMLLSVLGLGVYGWKCFRKKQWSLPNMPSLSVLVFLAATSAIYVLAIFWFDWQHMKNVGYSLGVQGRYYLPQVTAHMALLFTGILSWGWNDWTQEWLRKLLLVFFVCLQLGGIITILNSYYDWSTWQTFMIQASQYKPWFVKSGWWLLWVSLYSVGVGYCGFTVWKGRLYEKNARV